MLLSEDATEEADSFVKLGFEYAALDLLQVPYHATLNWTKMPADSGYALLGKVNLAVRSAKTFALRVERPMFGKLHEQPAFGLLEPCETLTFKCGDIAHYVFGYDSPHHKVDEGVNAAGPLAGTSFVTTTGWLAFGLAYCDGRIVRAEHSGELKHLSELPDLVSILEKTQHFRLTGYR